MTNHDTDKRSKWLDIIVVTLFATVFFTVLSWLKNGDLEAKQIMFNLINQITACFGMVVWKFTRPKKNNQKDD